MRQFYTIFYTKNIFSNCGYMKKHFKNNEAYHKFQEERAVRPTRKRGIVTLIHPMHYKPQIFSDEVLQCHSKNMVPPANQPVSNINISSGRNSEEIIKNSIKRSKRKYFRDVGSCYSKVSNFPQDLFIQKWVFFCRGENH